MTVGMPAGERLRIYHVVPSLNVGGRERLLVDIVKKHDRDRFDVGLCCLRKSGALADRLKDEGIEIEVFNKKDSGVDKGLYLRLARFFRERRADIVHTHNPGSMIYGVVGAILSRRNPVTVNTEHGYEYSIGRLKRRTEAFLCRWIDMNICVSRALEAQLSMLGYPADKLMTLYNGIDMTAFPVNGGIGALRKMHGFHEEEFLVGNVARLAKVKNHRMLLDAMGIVLKEVPAKLVIVGDGELRSELEALADKLGISDNVVFAGTTERVGEYLAMMDIFVLSSLSEGISLTILEAMASSKAVVATDVGGNPEVIVDGETGILVPSGSSSALADAIVRLLKDRPRAGAMGAEGRRRVEKYFDIDRMVRTMEDMYISLYKRKRHHS